MSDNGKLLRGRNAFIFAAGGEVSSAVAREFAAQGANLFLSARKPNALKALADSIQAHGVHVHCSRVDATDPAAVEEYLSNACLQGRQVDIVFNGIGVCCAEGYYGVRSTDLPLREFLLPLNTIAGSQFLTATRAARLMKNQRSGTILLLTASLAKSAIPFMAGITAACDAIEGLARVLGAEFAEYGVRVACLRAGGMPETRTIQETMIANAKTLGMPVDVFAEHMRGQYGLQLKVDQLAQIAAFLASDLGASLSSEPLNVGFA